MPSNEVTERNSLPERLVISGSRRIAVVPYLIGSLGIAVLIFRSDLLTREGLLWCVGGFALLVVALLTAPSHHHYVDLQRGEVVYVQWFGGIENSTIRTPFRYFTKIVVRHVCHPGGEGEDTYTGSVGLKPADGSATLWVKEFPATKDEMPTQPDAFARKLAARINLPYTPTLH